MVSTLRFGPLGAGTVHLCIDMQRLFVERTDWRVPWLERVLPTVVRLAETTRSRTVFTRFVPPPRAEEAVGSWRRYYRRWCEMTGDRLDPRLIELVPPLAGFTPPARVVDKAHYSPFAERGFVTGLHRMKVDTLVISGGETDVCVLATVMDAVDAGYRVVLVQDALCSAADESHDAVIRLFEARFSQQVELAPSDEILANWPRLVV